MPDLDRLRQLERKATPGPWKYEPGDVNAISGLPQVTWGVAGWVCFVAFPDRSPDAALIAEARNALPRLLDVAAAAWEYVDLRADVEHSAGVGTVTVEDETRMWRAYHRLRALLEGGDE